MTPRPDRTLSDLLVSGEIDAVISARPPLCFVQGARGVRRLFPDFRKEEERYFARTGIFPIMHVIAIRRPVYEANPWIARNLLDAFETAKRAGLARLRDIQTSHLPSAWATDEMERVHKLLFPDGDRWPYGLEPNRPTLEAFLAYAHEQGVTRRRLSCEELSRKKCRSRCGSDHGPCGLSFGLAPWRRPGMTVHRYWGAQPDARDHLFHCATSRRK